VEMGLKIVRTIRDLARESIKKEDNQGFGRR
jgi:hypothetical protein